MIRLYLDSDVINNIHTGRMPELLDFIEKNRHKVLITYSQAHVSDKLPSKLVQEKKFWEDLDYLTQITNNKLLYFDNKKGQTIPCIATARQVLEEVEKNNEMLDEFSNIDNIINFMDETSEELGVPEIGKMFKTLFEIPAINISDTDWMQGKTFKDQLQQAADYMTTLRNDPSVYKDNQKLVRSEFELPDHAGQWTEGVVDKLDVHLKSKEKYNDFFDLVDSAFHDKDKITRFSYYTTAYQMLNLVGYKSDEIIPKKKKGLPNHLQDAMHSFYGAHCDYFVAMDKKLTAKSKALYEKFGITTKLIHPSELVTELTTKCYSDKMDQIVSKVFNNNPIDILEEEGIVKSLYRIGGYWLNYFTNMQYEHEPSTGRSMLLFTKMGANYSNFTFFEEYDNIITAVHDILGIQSHNEEAIKKFKSDDPENRFVEYILPNSYVKLTTDGAKFYLWIVFPGEIKN